MQNITAIGNAICDIIFQIEEKILMQFDLPKGGMVLCDKQKCSSILECLKNKDIPFSVSSGGSAANTISFLSQYGINSTFIGNVSNGYYGKKYINELQNNEIRFINTHKESHEETAKSIILVTPDGERTMCTYLGCASEISLGKREDEAIKDQSILYVEGYLWDRAVTKRTISSLINTTRDKDGQVALSLSDSFCVERHLTEFRKLANEQVDLLFGNEHEILALYDIDSLSESNLMVLQANLEVSSLKNLIITRAEKGAIIITNNKIDFIDSKKKNALDCTGAGDSFAAGFLYGYINKFSNYDSALIANNIAGKVIEHIGARPKINLPKTISDIEDLNEINASKVS